MLTHTNVLSIKLTHTNRHLPPCRSGRAPGKLCGWRDGFSSSWILRCPPPPRAALTQRQTHRTEETKTSESQFTTSILASALDLCVCAKTSLYLWSCRKSRVWKPGWLWSAPPRSPEWETDSCRMRSADWPETRERFSAGEASGIEWRTHLMKTSTVERTESYQELTWFPVKVVMQNFYCDCAIICHTLFILSVDNS